MSLAGPSSSVLPYQHSDLAASSRYLQTILWGGIAGGSALVLFGVVQLAEWGAFAAWPIVRPPPGVVFSVDRRTWLEGEAVIAAGVMMVVASAAVLVGRTRLSIAWLLALAAFLLLLTSQAGRAARQYQYARSMQGFPFISAIITEWAFYALPLAWPATLALALRRASIDETEHRTLRALRVGGLVLGILVLAMSSVRLVRVSRRIGWTTGITTLPFWEMRGWLVAGAVVGIACVLPTLTVARRRRFALLACVLLCVPAVLGWLSLFRTDIAQRLEMVYGPQWWMLEALLLGSRCLVTTMPVFVLFAALRRPAVGTQAATA